MKSRSSPRFETGLFDNQLVLLKCWVFSTQHWEEFNLPIMPMPAMKEIGTSILKVHPRMRLGIFTQTEQLVAFKGFYEDHNYVHWTNLVHEAR